MMLLSIEDDQPNTARSVNDIKVQVGDKVFRLSEHHGNLEVMALDHGPNKLGKLCAIGQASNVLLMDIV